MASVVTIGVLAMIYIGSMVFKESESSSSRLRVRTLGWKKYLTEQIVAPFLIGFLLLGSAYFYKEDFYYMSEVWSVPTAEWITCGVACYLAFCFIICLNSDNFWKMVSILFFGTLGGVIVLFGFVDSRSGFVLMPVCVAVYIGFFIKHEIEARYSVGDDFSSKFIFGLFALTFCGATVAYCMDYWPDIVTHFNVIDHDHRKETILWIEAVCLFIIAPIVKYVDLRCNSWKLHSLFFWVGGTVTAILFWFNITIVTIDEGDHDFEPYQYNANAYVNVIVGLIVIFALYYCGHMNGRENDERKYLANMFVCGGVILAVGYGAVMAFGGHYYSGWMNVLTIIVISLCVLLLFTLLYVHGSGDDISFTLCFPLLIGFIACCVILNTHDGIPAILANDASENDYWIRIVIYSILSITPVPVFWIIKQADRQGLSFFDSMRILYGLIHLSFIASGCLYVWFFGDLAFRWSKDAYVWMIRILPLIACSLFSYGLHKIHGTST
eukprot:TRINITY_DN3411_c0_g1_i1.p1 TRINITY_DN3411_c0_g1~~TRINITY_DN3411_c0_g1_i1.p1  ORF type:complete len:495 (-),score=36.62 TRINITY_DN3411_c0_g1_i1:22-1506(-)